jgi:hypothetical protein
LFDWNVNHPLSAEMDTLVVTHLSQVVTVDHYFACQQAPTRQPASPAWWFSGSARADQRCEFSASTWMLAWSTACTFLSPVS